MIFLDIDGTLLDANYTSNDATLPATIRQLQQNGNYVFGLNSNRSIEDMLSIAETFSIQGPVVGENGVFAYYPATRKTEYFVSEEQLNNFTTQKQVVEQAILKNLQLHFAPRRVIWKSVDTVESISGDLHDDAYGEGDIVVLNNIFRKYTTSAHIFEYRKGELNKIPSKKLKVLLDNVRAAVLGSNMTIAYDFNFSNILAYSSLVSKRSAVKKLIALYQGYTLYSVGDDMNDFLMTEGIGRFLTTGNSRAKIKAQAQYVASASFAKGVSEILAMLPQQLAREDSMTVEQLGGLGYTGVKVFTSGETVANLYLGVNAAGERRVIKLGSVYGDNTEIDANQMGYNGLAAANAEWILPSPISYGSIGKRAFLSLPYLGDSISRMDLSGVINLADYKKLLSTLTAGVLAGVKMESSDELQRTSVRVLIGQLKNWLSVIAEAGFISKSEYEPQLTGDSMHRVCSSASSLMLLDFTPDNVFFSGDSLSFIDPWNQITYRGSFVPSLAQFGTLSTEIMQLPGATEARELFGQHIAVIGEALNLTPKQIRAQSLLGEALQYCLSSFVRINRNSELARRYAGEALNRIREYGDLCNQLMTKEQI